MDTALENEKGSAGFQFMITLSGKDYVVSAFTNQPIIKVEETHRGFWTVFNSLHGFNEEIPDAPAFINSWGIYSNVVVFVILFSIISGIYIFSKK